MIKIKDNKKIRKKAEKIIDILNENKICPADSLIALSLAINSALHSPQTSYENKKEALEWTLKMIREFFEESNDSFRTH